MGLGFDWDGILNGIGMGLGMDGVRWAEAGWGGNRWDGMGWGGMG